MPGVKVQVSVKVKAARREADVWLMRLGMRTYLLDYCKVPFCS